MSRFNKSLDVQNFYPKQLEITRIVEKEQEIDIKIFAKTQECACPKCGIVSRHHHGTYRRKIQDLPILGKTTWLMVNAYEYQCSNPDCDTSTFADNCEGFLNYYSRMTKRCEDLVCTLALETNCEGCARICRSMNLKTSGDSIIRLLVKRFSIQLQVVCGKTIGVDDFAFKKQNTYGTIIVDEKTHKPLAILQGRDGSVLKEWLGRNKHIKRVTRDRPSAYSSAIQEILPDAMQVADRFHLHQNLLEAVKEAVNSVAPVDIKIPIGGKREGIEPAGGKKITQDVDNFPEYDEKKVKLYHEIQEYISAGYSWRQIIAELHCSSATVIKYRHGDYESLCRKNFCSGMEQFYDYIIKALSTGTSREDVYRNVKEKGIGKIRPSDKE